MNKDIELQPNVQQEESLLYNDVCEIIDGARSRVATYANTKNLRHCLRAAETFSQEEIVSATRKQSITPSYLTRNFCQRSSSVPSLLPESIMPSN